MHVKDGEVIGYYCDRHMAYLTLKEDSMNNGLYRASRLFRTGEFREKNLREVLEMEGGEAAVERITYLLVEALMKYYSWLR